MKVALCGFGRFGRAVFRQLLERPGIEVVAVNETAGGEALAHLLRHDAVRGRFPGGVELVDGCLVTERGATRLTAVAGSVDLPWRELGVDVVVLSCDGVVPRGAAADQLVAGAGRVIVAAEARDPADSLIAMGVNQEHLLPAQRVVAIAPAVTGCLAPLARVLNREFGLEQGMATAVRPYGGDQCLVDAPHDDLRRGRAAALNQVPIASGAARAVGVVIPSLAGRLEGMELRVPTACGTFVELVATIRKETDVMAVNDAMRIAAALPHLDGIVGIADDPVVSSDLIGDTRSCLFDPGCTGGIGGRLVRVVAWLDEDWAQAARVCDLLERLSGMPIAG